LFDSVNVMLRCLLPLPVLLFPCQYYEDADSVQTGIISLSGVLQRELTPSSLSACTVPVIHLQKHCMAAHGNANDHITVHPLNIVMSCL